MPRRDSRPCRHRGPELTGPEREALHAAGQTHVTHSRKFALCMRPEFFLTGVAVCGCKVKGRYTCDYTCRGYDPPVARPD